jgi:hypothetical protein
VSANHILQNFLSAENVPEWKWAVNGLDTIGTFLYQNINPFIEWQHSQLDE